MQLTSRAGKAVKRGAMSFIDEVLPNCHVVERTGIESGGIKNTDIKNSPTSSIQSGSFDEQKSHVMRPHGDEVIPAV